MLFNEKKLFIFHKINQLIVQLYEIDFTTEILNLLISSFIVLELVCKCELTN